MKHTQTNNKMFLATWSISETPVEIRNMIFPLVSDFHSFLIAYQDKFEEVNNLDYFSLWNASLLNESGVYNRFSKTIILYN